MTNEAVITIDIGASKIRIQTVDRQGNVDPGIVISIVGLDLNNEAFISLLVEQVQPLIADNIIGISIGAPGLVDSDTGIIEILPNIKNVADLNIAEQLKNNFNLPVFILNDANAAVLGEWWLGAAQGFKDIIYLTLGTGVGSGMIIDDEVQSRLELGHEPLIIKDREQPCSCGEMNHAESYLGTEGLATIYAEIFGIEKTELSPEYKNSLSPKMREGVEAGDSKWLEVQEKYAEYLAIFIHNIILDHRSEIIILGGGIIYSNMSLLHETEKFLGKTEVRLQLAKFENAGNLGAAKYAFDLLTPA